MQIVAELTVCKRLPCVIASKYALQDKLQNKCILPSPKRVGCWRTILRSVDPRLARTVHVIAIND